MIRTNIDKEKYFDKLIHNMLENLNKSLDCIKTDGKTSIICYFSALELLFKARLFKEHWALIFQNIDDRKSNINNLKNGDFYTVSFDTAISRIQNLLQDLDVGYKTHFEDLKQTRNRLIHFDCIEKDAKDLSISKISETWYYVYYLLNIKWKDMFSEYSVEIEKINNKMQKFSEHFWHSKKEALIKSNINKYKNNPLYSLIKIHNRPLICDYCNLSFDKSKNLNFMKMQFDNETFTLTRKCDICEHEDLLFLFSQYMQKNNSVDRVRIEFKKLIEQNLWTQKNSVNASHYKALLVATPEELDIDFMNLEHWNYNDYEIEIEPLDESTTNIQLKFFIDFTIEIDECPAYYVLYTNLIFTVNMSEKQISTSKFDELYDSIDHFNVNFFIDSDGF